MKLIPLFGHYAHENNAMFNATQVPEQTKRNERVNIDVINTNKEIAEKLLNYAINDPDIVTEADLINKIIPLLRKDNNLYADQDEIDLCIGINTLTHLVSPATYLSLSIVEKFAKKKPPFDFACSEFRTIFFYLISTVILYIIIQGYSAVLSNTLDESKNFVKEWEVKSHNILNLNVVSQTAITESKINTPNQIKNELEDVKNQLLVLDKQIATSTETLAKLISLVTQFNLNFSKSASPDISQDSVLDCSNLMINQTEKSFHDSVRTCHLIQEQLATSIITILTGYILPLILGTLGAIAFSVRQMLYSLKTNSYLPGANGRLSMRLCLGGLLGVISGIFISSGKTIEPDAFNINIVLISLMMGYSMELAFSIFDSAIERISSWTEFLKKPL